MLGSLRRSNFRPFRPTAHHSAGIEGPSRSNRSLTIAATKGHRGNSASRSTARTLDVEASGGVVEGTFDQFAVFIGDDGAGN